MEKYSRGWRGAPAKGVGRSRGARVQIPLSPFHIKIKMNLDTLRIPFFRPGLWSNKISTEQYKKVLTKNERDDMIRFHREKVVEMRLKNLKRKLKRCWQTTKHMILYQSCVERYNTEPWQINSNATLKILNKELFREQNLNKVNERLNLARVNFDQRSKLKHESLILAQDERWRRA